ncbi:sugar transporter, putative [Plasmodium sp. gorilla clade G3]|nr:sugar transporter, putative [Plasmodium sp. gorilla clade G3]
MLYITKIISNACLAMLNCGMCITATNMARKFIVQEYEICPMDQRGCNKEKWYFICFSFILYMSALFGCFLCLFFKSLNRRKFMLLINYLFMIGSLLTIYNKPHIIIFLFTQAFFGLSIGCSFVIVCFYVLEYSTKTYQNFYGFYLQTFFALGMFISYLFGAAYENIKFDNLRRTHICLYTLYKIHFLLPTLFSLISVLLFHFVYKMDTPLHLYEKKSYKKYETVKFKINMEQLDEVTEYHRNKTNKEVKFLMSDMLFIDFWNNKKLFNTCLITSLICYLYSFSGCFLFFTKPFVFYKSFSTNMANTFICVGFILWYIICTIISTIISQYYKKRDLLIIGLVLQIIASTAMVASYFVTLTSIINKIIITTAIFLYFLGLSLGFGHIIWTHVFETFPNECRILAAFCSYYALFIAAFIISALLEFISINYYSYVFITFLISLILSVICFNYFQMEDVVVIHKSKSFNVDEKNEEHSTS